MLANGITVPLPFDMARQVAEILRKTGRTVDPGDWIPKLVRQAEDKRIQLQPHNIY